VCNDKLFSGGYITRHYGNNPLPCIQIELNRAMYLNTPWFDQQSQEIQQERIIELQQNFKRSLEILCTTPDSISNDS
jgi:N-formylglutamate amidohydrolase